MIEPRKAVVIPKDRRRPDPKRLQQNCDGLSAAKIDALLRKWQGKLPCPYTAADRKAGYRYNVSILQFECSLTHVLDRPGVRDPKG